MVRRALTLVLVAACADDWPPLEPDDRGADLDPRLGIEVFRTTQGLRIASLHQDDGLVVVFEDLGRGWHLRRVDVDGTITELPTPPLEPREGLRLGRAAAPVRAVVATTRDAVHEVHVLDEDWTTLPPLPVSGSPDTLGAVVAHDGAVWATASGRVLRWDGAAWSEPVTGAASHALGGFDATTQWVVSTDVSGQVAAAVPVDTAGTAGAPVAGPAASGPVGSSINGDAGAFQIVAGARLWRFDGQAFVAGDTTSGVPSAAPGSSRILLREGDGSAATWRFAEDGVVGEVALAPFTPQITCTCDAATDPTCGCIPHPVGYLDVDPSPSTEHIALTMADAHDGRAVLTVRFLPVPFAGDPFAPDR